MSKFRIRIHTAQHYNWVKENLPDAQLVGMTLVNHSFENVILINGWAYTEGTEVDAAMVAMQLSTPVEVWQEPSND